MIKAEITTIEEEFEKSRVKAHVRTRRGKLERVREFSRRGKTAQDGLSEYRKFAKEYDKQHESEKKKAHEENRSQGYFFRRWTKYIAAIKESFYPINNG